MTALSFVELQRQLQPSWGHTTGGMGPEVDVLLVPSLSMDQSQMALVTGSHHYEERQLFALIGLRHPGVRMVYA
ncbi:carboxylate-amine ligase, partial [Cyanobium sp. LEGE 06143]|nr:carboxylate-amine ligase [Cyanobium sp. LEGE 06143]